MIRRPTLAAALATALAVAAAPAAALPPISRSPSIAGSYWVTIAMPDRDPTAAMLVLDEVGGALHGILIVEGSPAVSLDKLSVEGETVRAELPTSAGMARLTVRLKEKSGEGTLVLVAAGEGSDRQSATGAAAKRAARGLTPHGGEPA